MSFAGPSAAHVAQAYRPDGRRIARTIAAAGPGLLYGLRVSAAVCLALYVAFWLELDNAYWAGTSAAIVAQPSLGASLRKASFRMIGTFVGAVAIVVLSACFPENRIGFLLGLALWGSACGLVATILRNFATYAAALAGYTAAIIAYDELGATGGTNGQVFMLAVTRASEVCIGIVCAGIVLAGTDFGGARRRLAGQLAAIVAEIAGGLSGAFLLGPPDQEETRSGRRDLIRRVIALGPVIDEAMGEESDLRYRWRTLQAPVEGLFAALTGWRAVSNHLATLSNDEGQREATLVLQCLPPELRSAPVQGDATIWAAAPSRLRRICESTTRTLVALPASTPSLKLLADGTAEALIGLSRALNELTLLTDPARVVPSTRAVGFRVPDFLPSLVNAARVFLTIIAVALFWIVTAWPDGALAVTWAAIAVILFSPRAEQAYVTTMQFMLGTTMAVVLAAIVKFAVLPGQVTFAGFGIVLGCVFVPMGALAAQQKLAPIFLPMTSNFIPFLAPENQISYDTQQFYNTALGIVAGMGAAMLAMRLIPPLSPQVVARRLLTLTLTDLRRLARRPVQVMPAVWENRVYSRLSALPEQASPVQRAQLLAALSVGTQITRVRRIARGFDMGVDLALALGALACGNSAAAIERLARMDRALAVVPSAQPGLSARLRARGSIRDISEALRNHAAYFDGRALR